MKPEEKITADLEKYGWHYIHVLEDEVGEKYTYTIGFKQSFNNPEIAISGLKYDISARIFQSIVELIQEGNTYEVDKMYKDILEDYDCTFKLIGSEKYDYLFGKAAEYYKEEEFKVLQFVYPDKKGNFPWDENYALTIQKLL